MQHSSTVFHEAPCPCPFCHRPFCHRPFCHHPFCLGPFSHHRSRFTDPHFSVLFRFFQTARDAQRALVVARTRPIQLQNAVVVMEPNLYATPDYRARVGLATPDQAAPSYRHNPNPKGPKHRQLQYPVYLRDIPKTVQLADLERDLGRFGKIADISYQPCVGGHVVYFEVSSLTWHRHVPCRST